MNFTEFEAYGKYAEQIRANTNNERIIALLDEILAAARAANNSATQERQAWQDMAHLCERAIRSRRAWQAWAIGSWVGMALWLALTALEKFGK